MTTPDRLCGGRLVYAEQEALRFPSRWAQAYPCEVGAHWHLREQLDIRRGWAKGKTPPNKGRKLNRQTGHYEG